MKTRLQRLCFATLAFVATFFVAPAVQAQQSISAGATVSQDFNGLGASSTAALPTNWRVSKSANERTIVNFATAVSAVELAAGNNVSGTAGNGIYRGNANGATNESAIGGLSSGSASRTVSVYYHLSNTGASNIASFNITYDVEKYRRGTNANFTMELFYSTNGTSWTSCGPDFVTSFTADADNTGYTVAPGATTSVSNKVFTPAAPISNGQAFYFAWRYSVSTGSTTSNAPLLTVDNVSITANATAANNAPSATNVAFTGSLFVGQTLTGSYTYNDVENNPEGASTFRWYRADNASGLNEAAINGANSSTYTLTNNEIGKFIRFSVTPISTEGTQNGSETFSPRQGPVQSATNSLSTITVSGAYTPASNVNYALFQGTDVTTASYELVRFSLNDVAGSPDDGFATTLTALTLSMTQSAQVERVALYDGTTEIQELAAAATLNFTGLNLVAASGSSKLFSLLITFKASVTDNTRPQVTITSATADLAGSLFAAGNAGGASSSTTLDENRIEVTASTLAFGVQPLGGFSLLPITPSFTVRAVDALSNLDLDFVDAISLTTPQGFAAGSTTSTAAVAGVATFANVSMLLGGTGQVITANSTVTSANSAAFDVASTLVGNPITGSNPNNSNPYTTGMVTAADVTSSGVGRSTGVGAIVGTNANDRYNANTWNVPSFDPNKYFEFKITPGTGKQIDFTNFVVQLQQSSATTIQFRTSVDNFATVFATLSAAAAPGFINTVDISTIQDISSEITFRIYGFGTSGSTATLSVNNYVFTGTVENTPNPSLNATPGNIANLNYPVANGPSSSQTITVNATNLTPANDFLTITAPANFEVSIDNTTFAPSVQLPYTGNSLTNAPVYVRLASGLSANNYSGSVQISGGGTSSFFVTVSGTVYVPFSVPYFNAFNTQTLYNNAGFQGFQYSATAFNPGGGGYALLSINGTITSPAIDVSAGLVEVSFDGATFGGNTGQTLTLEASEDGIDYTVVGSITYTSSNYVNFRQTIDFNSFINSTAFVRVRMSAGTNTSRFRNFYISTFTTWNGASWTNGAPNATKVAIIDGDYNTTTYGDISAKSLTVTSGDVLANGLGTISLVEDLVVNGGSVVFESGSNFIQQNNNYANAGNITVKRVALLKRQDYIYWGAPVAGQNLLDFSPLTLTNRFYRFDEPSNNFVSVDPSTTSFVAGRGYMIRSANNHPSTNTNWTGTFVGVPNNGTYNVPVTRTSSGYNIIANPYPSPISCQSFVAANPNIGTLYFWAHITQGAGSAANYATWNGTGAAAPAGGATPNGTIQTGQGFLVQLPATPTITSVNFNNGMRIDDHGNQFFRPGRQTMSEGTSQPNRLWIDLTSGETNYNQVLLGYVDGATAAFDTNFDGKMIGSNTAAIYTLLDNEKYTIQGKANPVDLSDETALGFSTETAGNFTFTLANIDGIFANGQNIYIRDYATGTVHNLSEGPFTFASEIGTFNDRFSIVYEGTTLNVNNPVETNNAVVAIRNNNGIQINAGSATLQQVTVFDITGRQITSVKASGNQTTVATNNLSNQVLLVKIVTDKGTVTKKLAY
ncbi:T9SS sorting signal type C domain-containing protein [Flavobacterium sp.]|uniref:beta strand repeat-containing protein n=1 Tax=Flavobacterium sp. TaxID=239 RepID=UPI0026054876|nr:T9SS sorting signal type C domain-containing protein [Flavobacterium sp.]